jgi:hypothetical protein
VTDHYYHEVHRAPFFSINFDGSIRSREVRVRDCEADVAPGFRGTQRSLDFGESSGNADPGQCSTPANGGG